MSNKQANNKPTWTPFTVIVLTLAFLVGLAILIIFLPTIQAFLASLQEHNNAGRISGCGFDEEMENAQAVFCQDP